MSRSCSKRQRRLYYNQRIKEEAATLALPATMPFDKQCQAIARHYGLKLPTTEQVTVSRREALIDYLDGVTTEPSRTKEQDRHGKTNLVKIDPEITAQQQRLAQVLDQLGETEEALEDLELGMNGAVHNNLRRSRQRSRGVKRPRTSA